MEGAGADRDALKEKGVKTIGGRQALDASRRSRLSVESH